MCAWLARGGSDYISGGAGEGWTVDEAQLVVGAADGQAIGSPFRYLGALTAVRSGGGAWAPHRPCSVEDLLRRADERMYADKQFRTDRYVNLIRVPAKA